jgi:hypothetical protein
MYNADIPSTPSDVTPYSFYAEWTLRLRSVGIRPDHENRVCAGVDMGFGFPLCGMTCFGTARVEDVDLNTLATTGFPTLHRLLRTLEDRAAQTALLKRLRVPVAIGQRDRVCSPFCTVTSTGMACGACAVAASRIREDRVAQLADRLQRVQSGAVNNIWTTDAKVAICSVPNSRLTDVERLAKLGIVAGEKRITEQLLQRKAHELQRAKETIEDLRTYAMQPLSTASLLGFVEKLKKANDGGALARDSVAAIKLVETIIQNMATNHGTPAYDSDTKHFYAILLLHGGPRIHEFVSSALLGPSVTTTQRFLREHKTGTIYDWGKGLFHTAAGILCDMGLKDAPCIIVEDGTALNSRYDVVRYKDKVVLFGASTGPIVFKAVHDLEEFHAKPLPTMATQFYLYLLVPLVQGAPAIPIAVKLQDGTKGTYNAKVVAEAWRDGWEALIEKGVKIVGHSGDGASAIRSAMLHHMHRDVPDSGVGKATSLQHPLVQVIVPYLNREFPIFMFPDYLHIIFRLRRIFLDPKHFLVVFGMPCCPSKIVTWELEKSASESLGVRANDLNANDKQHFAGCMRLFDIKIEHTNGKASIVDVMRKAFRDDPDYVGVAWYLELCHKFTRVFLVKKRRPEDVLEDCGWCLAFLGYWDMHVSNDSACNKKKNFLTAETKTDMILLLQSVVLYIHVFARLYPNVYIALDRLSSRYAEYAFQRLRAHCRNNDNRVSALSGMYRVEMMRGMLVSEFIEDRLVHLQSKRGRPQAKEAIDEKWDKAPAGYYPSAEVQMASIERGAQTVIAMLGTTLCKGGCGGEGYTPWDSLPNEERPVEVMAAKYLLHQRKACNTSWATHFTVGSLVETTVEEYEAMGGAVEGDDDYEHDDPHEYAMEKESGQSHAMAEALASIGDEMQGGTVGDNNDQREATLVRDARRQAKHDSALASRRSPRLQATVQLQEADENDAKHAEDLHMMLGCQEYAVQAMRDFLETKVDMPCRDEGGAPLLPTGITELDQVETILRELCARMNGLWKPKENTRRVDRFLPPLLWDRVNWKNRREVLEDEDVLAIPYPVEVQNSNKKRPRAGVEVWFAIVERCTREQGKAVVNCHCLWATDPGGRLHVKFFEPVWEGNSPKRDTSGRRLFTLPLRSDQGFNHVIECANVLTAVAMTLPVKRADGGDLTDALGNLVYDDYWVLSIEDELVVDAEAKALATKMHCELVEAGGDAKRQCVSRGLGKGGRHNVPASSTEVAGAGNGAPCRTRTSGCRKRKNPRRRAKN